MSLILHLNQKFEKKKETRNKIKFYLVYKLKIIWYI